MTTEVSSIDDLLTGAKNPQQPAAPEHQPEDISYGNDEPESSALSDELSEQSEPERPDSDYEPEESESKQESEPESQDEYGNPSTPERTYTEKEHRELVNKAVRERLERLERNNPQLNPQQIQQIQNQAQGFEYDPESPDSWQQQLKGFVKQTFNEISQEQTQQQVQQRERQAQAEFETKFHEGMSKFSDFRDVVGNQPITDAMTIATRAMKDPAAFLYAAAKRQPQELNRIANIADPYTQMVEMGKLEERMRKAKPTTKAPKPLSRTQEDASMPHKNDKEPSIEDLIAKADAKRRAALSARRR
jgi:hypothetical protein